MDWDAIGTLAHDVMFGAWSVDATLTIPDGDPVPVSLIWMDPTVEDTYPGGEIQRREAKHLVAFRNDQVAAAPHGSILLAPRKPGGTVERWQVDGIARLDLDLSHYVVVPAPDPLTAAPEL